MGYCMERETLTKQQWLLIVSSILLMIPVFLDASNVISLEEWHMAPFLILLVLSAGTVRSTRRDD